jgi:hypothetical protein
MFHRGSLAIIVILLFQIGISETNEPNVGLVGETLSATAYYSIPNF